MSDLKTILESQKAELDRCRAILHQSKDEATGQALSKLLTIQLERSVAKLMTTTDHGELRAAQGEVMAIQRIIDFQQKSPITPSNQ